MAHHRTNAWHTRRHAPSPMAGFGAYTRWRRCPYWFRSKLRGVRSCPFSQGRFKLGRFIEVILKRGFAARRYKNEFFYARRSRFVDRVLDERAINQSHNLLWNRLGRGKKSCSETCHWKNRLGHTLFIITPLVRYRTSPVSQHGLKGKLTRSL